MTWQPGDAVTIDTTRFLLRDLLISDVSDAVAGWFLDPDIVEHLNIAPSTAHVDTLKNEIARVRNRQNFRLGIFDKAKQELIGTYRMSIDLQNLSGASDVIIGRREWWGKDVVVETRRALIDFMFEEMTLEKIGGIVFCRNLPTVHSYQALGFTCEGILRQQRRSIKGGRLDQFQFGLLRDEWLSQRGVQ